MNREKLDSLEKLATRMDALFRIPGTGITIGLDSLIGLLPGLGDTAALLPAGYIIQQAHKHGMPRNKLIKMGINTGIDFVIGAIPLIGDIFDIGWKGNMRNVALLRDHFAKEQAAPMIDAASS